MLYFKSQIVIDSSKKIKGRGAQISVKNRFSSTEYSKDENYIDLSIHEIEASKKTEYIKVFPKKIVNKVTNKNVPSEYSMNPYQGCEHGCIYCYARPTHDYWGFNAGLDFERKILYKPNAAELLKKQLNSKNWKSMPILLSGNTDCYQPAERRFKLTRELLKVLLEYKHPVKILTKNSLIERDLDILTELAELNLVSTAMSFTSLDNKLRSNLEPRTSSAKNKLKTIELLSNNNIPIQILIGPIIPGLNSHEIPNIIEQTANAGANWAGYTIIRLFGSTLTVFEDWMDKTYPNQKKKVLDHIRGANQKSKEALETTKIIHSLVEISRNKYMTKSKIELDTTLFTVPKSQLSLF